MISRDHFRMRSYQKRAFEARRAGCKRFVQVLHRRAGKDRMWINFTVIEMMERVGVYLHIFPSLNQARRNVWDAVVRETTNGAEHPVKMIDAFPPELVLAKNETEMSITLINGSVYMLLGADSEESIERARGINAIGIILSEYSFMNSKIWVTLEPVLMENGGWVVFIYTPKDKGHGYQLYNYAKTAHGWFCELLTIQDTRKDAPGEDGGYIISPREIDEIRKRPGVQEEDLQREYYCSFEGFMFGTIYGASIQAARREKRIKNLPYVVNFPVGVCWDLGVSDHAAAWFYQIFGQAIHFIDYEEDRLKTADYYAKYCKEQKPYMYGEFSFPWDGRFSTGDFFAQAFPGCGIKIAEKKPVQEGINIVRQMFPQFYFDESKCAKGIGHIEAYSREFDEEMMVFKPQPKHDEHSHCADSLRTGAMAGFGPMQFSGYGDGIVKVDSSFDPREDSYEIHKAGR